MSTNNLIKEFIKIPELSVINESLNSGKQKTKIQASIPVIPLLISGIWQKQSGKILVIVPDEDEARDLAEKLKFWNDDRDNIFHYPNNDSLAYQLGDADNEATHQRIAALFPRRSKKPQTIVVASIDAVLQKTIFPELLFESMNLIEIHDDFSQKKQLEQWTKIGYEYQPFVKNPGEYSIRGGIIDVFPIGSATPYRVELWGECVESIRTFDQETQRSIQEKTFLIVPPAKEIVVDNIYKKQILDLFQNFNFKNCKREIKDSFFQKLHNLSSLEDRAIEELIAGNIKSGNILDYFAENSIVVSIKSAQIKAQAINIAKKDKELLDSLELRGMIPKGIHSRLHTWENLQTKIQLHASTIDIDSYLDLEEKTNSVIKIFSSIPNSYNGDMKRFYNEVKAQINKKSEIHIFTSAPNMLKESIDVKFFDKNVYIIENNSNVINRGMSFRTNDKEILVFSDLELFGISKNASFRKKSKYKQKIVLNSLTPGDYVVHIEYGIGKFLGTQIKKDGKQSEREYLIIQYAGTDQLLVPVEHLERLTQYVFPSDRPPRLTGLGTAEWSRSKKRAQEATIEMAGELLDTQASRELAKSVPCKPDDLWEQELEISFPYTQTFDQTEAINQVKEDMQKTRPMDRLICGDVGYGKTEVALRAAFKAAVNLRQVAILVPTTTLAEQHFNTFKERLKPYPVEIEVLSRLKTPDEQEKIIMNLQNGKIDICIGTHRMLQKDVEFANLGLLIIDEEQKFGVAQKEKLKQVRKEVDVLALTATPIPRTLHMSLAGVKDMSTVETPPEERLPIKTYIASYGNTVITDAIKNEIDRGGQAFFIHNRISSIDRIAGEIKDAIPGANVLVAHGRMNDVALSEAVAAFTKGLVDVLVCTTIVESGLDIQNANTIIINRADTFGLSQLYQLRGRVGRSSRRGYMYLLVPESKAISEVADRRLETMEAITQLSAGFGVAMKDLEIRGAGNVLGAEQSGHISAIGFDLYNKMLKEAVEHLRAQNQKTKIQPKKPTTMVSIQIPAFIPSDFVSNLSARLDYYQKIEMIKNLKNLEDISENIRDRFGPAPEVLNNLIYIKKLSLIGQELGIESIKRQQQMILIMFHSEIGTLANRLKKYLQKNIRIGHKQLTVHLPPSSGHDIKLFLDNILNQLRQFKESIETNI
ncbi:MAG: transcription-repair coupling factor [SAR202 cluster bacterium]|nr:transcription-repair coupling factor [SAR202 cluster bacterium]|tara:strand:- start:3688 stop:7155 length:3468 start_codon:yes stop_codon:yes gene_type:complete